MPATLGSEKKNKQKKNQCWNAGLCCCITLTPALLEAIFIYSLLLEHVPTLSSVSYWYYSGFSSSGSVYTGSPHPLHFGQLLSPLGLRPLQLCSVFDCQHTIQTICHSPAQITLHIVLFSVLSMNRLHKRWVCINTQTPKPHFKNMARFIYNIYIKFIGLQDTFWQKLCCLQITRKRQTSALSFPYP